MNGKRLESIVNLLIEHQAIAEQLKQLDAELQDTKLKIMQKMEIEALETLVGGENDEYRVTIVRPSTLKIDEEGLESSLSKAQWKLITKHSVDKKALENAIVRGKIDPSIVSDHSKEVLSKPYLRITG